MGYTVAWSSLIIIFRILYDINPSLIYCYYVNKLKGKEIRIFKHIFVYCLLQKAKFMENKILCLTLFDSFSLENQVP